MFVVVIVYSTVDNFNLGSPPWGDLLNRPVQKFVILILLLQPGAELLID
jgi:hypothetical protein